MQTCIHTNDKHYTTHDIERSSEIINENTRNNPNALNHSIWDSETIYWRCDSKYEWIDDKLMDKLISYAFLESSALTPLRIQKRNRSKSDAHIVINWHGKKDDSYFTSPATLAYGYGPTKGLGGNVTMNSDVLWLLRKDPLTAEKAKELGYIENYSNPTNLIKYYDPLHTLKHEAGGHALGMNHITDINQRDKAIMFPYYNGLRKFGDADISYLQSLYGKAGISKVIMETLRNKVLNF